MKLTTRRLINIKTVLILLLILTVLPGCNDRQAEADELAIIEIHGLHIPYYKVVIYDSGDLRITLGLEENGNAKPETKALSSEQLEELIFLLNQISDNPVRGDAVFDAGADILITYGDFALGFTYGLANCEEADKLISTIIDYSPMAIVDYNDAEIQPLLLDSFK